MTKAESYSGQERRARDRAAGIQLRRRRKESLEAAEDRRRSREDFDIAAALELHLDQITTRRGMVALLESWLREATQSETGRDENYVRAVGRAIEVMAVAPDALSGIAVLQRSTD